MTSNSAATPPVLIAGAGPTGMTAALELARFGVPVRLVERMAEPPTTSRAIGVQARTLELFERRGLAEAMLAAGNRVHAGVVHGGGKPIFRLDFAHVPSRYPFVLIISQVETERILRAELARRGVAIERGVELIALAQRESHEAAGQRDGVSATLRRADGTLEEVEAAYLIAAEGAHSLVRSSLNLPFAGKSFEEGYALGDFAVAGDLADDEMQVFSSPDGFLALFPYGKGQFRMVASHSVAHPAPGAEPTLAELQAIYDARAEVPARFSDLTWSSYFRINSRKVEQLQHGRVFLGGDSAHVHSPAGAQGMNTGIQDMINLGWKLALVLGGKASPDLLATYGDDRLPVIRGILDHTETLTRAFGSENPLFRAVFNQVAPLAVGTEYVQNKGTAEMSQVALGYRTSPLSATAAHHGHLRAGDRVPDLAVAAAGPTSNESDRLQARLDPTRFTLLISSEGAPDPWRDQVAAAVAPWGDLIRVRPVAPAAAPEDRARFVAEVGTRPALILVRPDSYIGFLGDETSLDRLGAYLRRWLPTEPVGLSTSRR